MEEKFKAWMIRSEGKLESTAINYSRAIHNLSEDEARKVERYRHEIPPVMRKGPPELRY